MEALKLTFPSCAAAETALVSYFTFPVLLDLTHGVHSEADPYGCQGDGDGEYYTFFHVLIWFGLFVAMAIANLLTCLIFHHLIRCIQLCKLSFSLLLNFRNGDGAILLLRKPPIAMSRAAFGRRRINLIHPLVRRKMENLPRKVKLFFRVGF